LRAHCREALPVARALQEINSLKGVVFDPQLTDLLLALVPRLQREQGDLDEFLGRAARASPLIRARESIAKHLRRGARHVPAGRERLEVRR